MMNEHDLMEALQERAADVPVGPAPLDTMARGAASTRRRHTLLTGLAAAAAVSVAVVGVVAVLPDDGGGTGRDDSGPAVAAEADVPPEGFRYVGMSGVAIAVPDAMPLDATSCGQPTESTYVVDPLPVQCDMYVPFPADADAVVVQAGGSEVPDGWTPVEIEGVTAYVSPTETATPDPASGEVAVSRASLLVPDQVMFAVSSSVSEERVAELLDGIVVLDGSTGVPGFHDLDVLAYAGYGTEAADEVYRHRLEAAGLEVESVDQTDRRKLPSGTIVSVTPEPGTLVEPGATVTVTSAR